MTRPYVILSQEDASLPVVPQSCLLSLYKEAGRFGGRNMLLHLIKSSVYAATSQLLASKYNIFVRLSENRFRGSFQRLQEKKAMLLIYTTFRVHVVHFGLRTSILWIAWDLFVHAAKSDVIYALSWRPARSGPVPSSLWYVDFTATHLN